MKKVIPFNFALCFLSSILLLSCNQKKRQNNSYHGPKVVEAKGFVVLKDSLSEPQVTLVDESQLKKIPVSQLQTTSTTTNIHPAGNPKIVLAGKPQVVVPGKDGYSLPKTIPAKDNTIVAGVPEVVAAKDPGANDPNPQNFSTFSQLQGLKHDFVSCMAEDHTGNLWFGMGNGGISKYDGKSYTHFTKKEGLSADTVQCILADHAGNLWFGTDRSGASKYDGKFFTHFTEKEGLCNNTIWSILEDRSGNLWFGTNGGVSKYDGKFLTHFTEKEGLGADTVKSIIEDHAGNLWFGTDGGGVSKYDGKSFTQFTEKEGLTNNYVSCILEDRAGNIWVGSKYGGVCKYDGRFFTHFTSKENLIDNIVFNISEDHAGNLWFCTGGGASKYDGKNFTNFTETEGLSSHIVGSALADHAGNLWLGTYKGVNKYDGKFFTHFTYKEGLSGNNVSSILEDHLGNLWFGAFGGGASKYDGKAFTHFTEIDGLSGNFIERILEDHAGNLWFGALGRGVSKYDGKAFIHFTEQEGLSDHTVNSTIEDHSGNLWFGTGSGGVDKYNGKSFTHFTKKQGLSADTIYCILEDHAGNLWFATQGGGLSKYDGKSFTHFTEKEGLSANIVYSILQDHTGNLWFATEGGVSKYDGKSFTHFTEKEGLSAGAVWSILEDHTGNLWFGGRSGLSLFTKKKQAEFDAKFKSNNFKESDVFFKSFHQEDGFLSAGCSFNAICEDQNGTIWIGTNDRLTAYHAYEKALKESPVNYDAAPPGIQLTGVQLFNENIPWRQFEHKKDSALLLSNGMHVGNFKFDSTSNWYGLPVNLSLAPNNNYLVFNYVGITMNQPKQVKYQYKLEGLDENWSAVTNRTEAPYVNLAPGSYTFKVKAMNGGGYWSKELSYPFAIRPPWWETWQAYLLYVLALGAAIWSYIQYRERKLRAQKQVLEETVVFRTKELKQKTMELEQKSTDLETSLATLKATQNQLIQSEKLASLGELTAGIAHEIQNPLNFVNNFAELSVDLARELKEEIEKVEIPEKDKDYIGEIIDDLSLNQEKINLHGKRASSIVKGMLEHSRSSTGVKEPTDVNALADEYFRLAYHGLRAKDKNFNASMETHFDPSLPKINVIPQDIGRVILNLVNNAFYAVSQKAKQNIAGYEPTVTVSTQKLENVVEIRVKDNGTGMPQSVKAKIFQPFFTTKPTGQGTGLGLSLAYDIVTKGHGGSLTAESAEGVGTEFVIALPIK